jgi:type I restriction enzyme S subunit
VPDPVDFVIAQDMVALRANQDIIDPLFLFAALRSTDAQRQIKNLDVSDVIPHFKKTDFDKLILPFPDRSTQKAIGRIYFQLCRKIDLSRRMNETLEAMARAIFKSWFVDYDPVRAKMDGRQPVGMDAGTAALFPDTFEDSPIGTIPRGWSVRKLDEVCDFAYGKALKEEDRRVGQVVVMGSNGQVGWHDRAMVRGTGVVVGRKGNPGTVRWVADDFYPIDTTFYVLPKNLPHGIVYLFHALGGLDLPSLGADSAVPGLSRSIAYLCNLLVPPTPLMRAFEDQSLPLRGLLQTNEGQSRTLAALRDALLPKLLSGEIRIKDAEKTVEVHL